jgi:hypothetical protein
MNRKKMKYSFKISQVLVLFLLIITIDSTGQIVFENGYFIDNSGGKTNCLIKNVDWVSNPTEFEYKTSEDGEVKTATIDSVMEFGVLNQSKYVRFTVDVDQSPQNLQALTKTRKPIFKEQTVFMKPIIEGEASLYYLAKPKLYFYSVGDAEVEQLVYKEYAFEGELGYNLTFRNQLGEDLKCADITILDINEVYYNLKDLHDIFMRYNKCMGSEITDYNIKKRQSEFHMSIKPGIRSGSLKLENPPVNIDVSFEKDLTFSFGLEFAYVLPFNKNKWAVTFEPTYQYFKSTDTDPVYAFEANYNSIELPVGITHNMFLNQKSRLFISGSVVILDIPFNTYIGSLEVHSLMNMNLGFGYKYNNKYSAEVRYATDREMLRNYASYSGKYNSVSIVLGYTIF